MRLALVHPTYWPEVRRGTERFIHDLSVYLAGQGHDVTVVTGHRGRPSRCREDGFTVIRGWRPPARLSPRGMEPHVGHAPLALLAVARRRFDVVHALHIPDGWATSWWSRLTGTPVVLSLMGYPDERSIDAFQGRRRMLAGAADRAGIVHALSDAATRALRQATGIDAAAIHLSTDTAAFHIDVPRAERPTIFCAASPADRRKRVPLLVEAFRVLRRSKPDAQLRIAGPTRNADLENLVGPGVTILGEIGNELLIEEYARAWVSVLPAEREAFGLVLVESLAAGTPAVGANDGAIPEILDDPRVGILCEKPEPDALAESMLQGLALGRSGGVREACRKHADRWDWRQLGPRYESLYRTVLADSNAAANRSGP